MEKNVKIIIACHKSCDVPADPIYLPMHVGSAGKEEIPGFTRDDSGENISEKNPVYCELTGLYWAWKNLDCDYLGLVHYRRYFTVRSRKERKQGLQAVLHMKELESLLGEYRVLVPKKRHYYIESIYSHYAHTFDGTQLDETREILADLYPEYVASFDKVMQARSAYIFNMFIMPKALVDDYCTWLFNILERLEEQVSTSDMTDFEKRYAGRISERLFNVWLMHQINIGTILTNEIKEIPYFYLEQIDWRKKATSFLKAKFFDEKYASSF